MKFYLTFDEFLSARHMDQYIGTDDDAPDDFENWITNMEMDEMIGWGNMYGELLAAKNDHVI